MTEPLRNPYVNKLLTLSEQDESVLSLPLPDGIFGFHAQQSCEKILKAWLSALAVVYPFDHSLTTLLGLLDVCGEQLPEVPYDLVRLDPYAVRFRYDFGPAINDTDRQALRVSIAALRSHVLGRLRLLDEP